MGKKSNQQQVAKAASIPVRRDPLSEFKTHQLMQCDHPYGYSPAYDEKLLMALLASCALGDEAMVDALLKNGVPVNCMPAQFRMVPLAICLAMYGDKHKKIITKLMAAGADINFCAGTQPLATTHKPLANMWVKNVSTNSGYTFLPLSDKNTLVSYLFSTSCKNSIIDAIDLGYDPKLDEESDHNALSWALSVRNLLAVDKILKLGANPNMIFKTQSVLAYCVEYIESNDFAACLIAHGADPTGKTLPHKLCPLSIAAFNRKFDATRMLIDQANVDPLQVSATCMPVGALISFRRNIQSDKVKTRATNHHEVIAELDYWFSKLPKPISPAKIFFMIDRLVASQVLAKKIPLEYEGWSVKSYQEIFKYLLSQCQLDFSENYTPEVVKLGLGRMPGAGFEVLPIYCVENPQEETAYALEVMLNRKLDIEIRGSAKESMLLIASKHQQSTPEIISMMKMLLDANSKLYDIILRNNEPVKDNIFTSAFVINPYCNFANLIEALMLSSIKLNRYFLGAIMYQAIVENKPIQILEKIYFLLMRTGLNAEEQLCLLQCLMEQNSLRLLKVVLNGFDVKLKVQALLKAMQTRNPDLVNLVEKSFSAKNSEEMDAIVLFIMTPSEFEEFGAYHERKGHADPYLNEFRRKVYWSLVDNWLNPQPVRITAPGFDMRYLLENENANTKLLPEKMQNSCDVDGNTVVHNLLKAGIDLETIAKLLFSVDSPLLPASFNFNAVNKFNENLMHLLATVKPSQSNIALYNKIFEYLKINGVDINAKNHKGETPFKIAFGLNNIAALVALISLGAEREFYDDLIFALTYQQDDFKRMLSLQMPNTSVKRKEFAYELFKKLRQISLNDSLKKELAEFIFDAFYEDLVNDFKQSAFMSTERGGLQAWVKTNAVGHVIEERQKEAHEMTAKPEPVVMTYDVNAKLIMAELLATKAALVTASQGEQFEDLMSHLTETFIALGALDLDLKQIKNANTRVFMRFCQTLFKEYGIVEQQQRLPVAVWYKIATWAELLFQNPDYCEHFKLSFTELAAEDKIFDAMPASPATKAGLQNVFASLCAVRPEVTQERQYLITLEKLIKLGVDINKKDRFGKSPFLIAAHAENDVATKLLAKIADVKDHRSLVAAVACKNQIYKKMLNAQMGSFQNPNQFAYELFAALKESALTDDTKRIRAKYIFDEFYFDLQDDFNDDKTLSELQQWIYDFAHVQFDATQGAELDIEGLALKHACLAKSNRQTLQNVLFQLCTANPLPEQVDFYSQFLRHVIVQGADVNAENAQGETPLKLAIQANNIIAINILMTYQANFTFSEIVAASALDFSCFIKMQNYKLPESEQARIELAFNALATAMNTNLTPELRLQLIRNLLELFKPELCDKLYFSDDNTPQAKVMNSVLVLPGIDEYFSSLRNYPAAVHGIFSKPAVMQTQQALEHCQLYVNDIYDTVAKVMQHEELFEMPVMKGAIAEDNLEFDENFTKPSQIYTGANLLNPVVVNRFMFIGKLALDVEQLDDENLKKLVRFSQRVVKENPTFSIGDKLPELTQQVMRQWCHHIYARPDQFAVNVSNLPSQKM